MKKLDGQHPRRCSRGRWQEAHGFSLIEVMAALFISAFVALSAYTLMSTQQRASAVNTRVTEMQQNARVAVELITQDLRTAGFGMAGAVGACNTAIVPADQNTGGVDSNADSISIVVPTEIGTLSAQFDGGPVANVINLFGGEVTASGIAIGDSISINGLVARTVATLPGDPALGLNTNVGAPATFPVGTPVYWLQCVAYQISTNVATCGGANTCLLRNGVPIADGIEDLQFAYACDGCGPTPPNPAFVDELIDDQNGNGAFDGGDFIFDDAWGTAPKVPDTIRLVRMSIVARELQAGGTSEDGTVPVSSPVPLQVEDHNHLNAAWYNAATYPQFRRRAMTRTVEIRNLGL
ncbi:MAG: PilW family protein [Nitrospiraceae bacterium]